MIIQHLIPPDDVREHDPEPTCWCRPEWFAKDRTYVHNLYDERDHPPSKHERGYN